MTSACLDRLAPLSTRRAFDRQRNTESAGHVDRPAERAEQRVDLNELPFTVGKDLAARSNETATGKEKTTPGTLLLSPDTACK